MATPSKITVHNKISANYKEIHVDGAYGGITPRGLINLSFFAERIPIPKSTEFELVNNTIGPLIKNSDDSKEGILREYEFGVYMSLEVVQSLITLLTTQAAELEKLLKLNRDAATKP